MATYLSQLPRLRFWKQLIRSFFAAVGMMAFIAGLWGLLYPEFFKNKWWIAALIIGAALAWALWVGRPHTPLQHYSCNTTIRLIIGDILEQNDANILIGMTSTFDTDVQSNIIASNSLQGQFLARIYGGSTRNLDDAIDNALAAHTPVRTISKPGKQAVYPVGTVATIAATNGKKYFCVAYTEFDDHNVARGSIKGILDSLNSVWDECDRTGNGQSIHVPLIGQGLARVPELNAEIALRLIAFSYLLRSRRSRFSEELVIVVHPDSASRIDMLEFQAFLASLGA